MQRGRSCQCSRSVLGTPNRRNYGVTFRQGSFFESTVGGWSYELSGFPCGTIKVQLRGCCQTDVLITSRSGPLHHSSTVCELSFPNPFLLATTGIKQWRDTSLSTGVTMSQPSLLYRRPPLINQSIYIISRVCTVQFKEEQAYLPGWKIMEWPWVTCSLQFRHPHPSQRCKMHI